MSDIIPIFLSAFLTGFFASIAATGPVTFLVFRNALLGRYSASVMMTLGAAIMETIYCSFAITIVGAVIVSYGKIQILSQWISVIVLCGIGVYLFYTDPTHNLSIGVEGLSAREKTRAFLTGFIFVALNPTVILTWSAASAILISFKIIEISGMFDVLLFTLSAGVGTIAGGMAMIGVVDFFRIRLSKSFLRPMLRMIGIIAFLLAGYFLFRVIGIF